MKARVLLAVSLILGTLASGAYWIGFLTLAFSVIGADYRTGEAPSDAFNSARTVVVWGLGLGIYAVGALLWRRMDFWIAGKGKSDG